MATTNKRNVLFLNGNVYSMTRAALAAHLHAVAAGNTPVLDGEGCKLLGVLIDGNAINKDNALAQLVALASD